MAKITSTRVKLIIRNKKIARSGKKLRRGFFIHRSDCRKVPPGGIFFLRGRIACKMATWELVINFFRRVGLLLGIETNHLLDGVKKIRRIFADSDENSSLKC